MNRISMELSKTRGATPAAIVTQDRSLASQHNYRELPKTSNGDILPQQGHALAKDVTSVDYSHGSDAKSFQLKLLYLSDNVDTIFSDDVQLLEQGDILIASSLSSVPTDDSSMNDANTTSIVCKLLSASESGSKIKTKFGIFLANANLARDADENMNVRLIIHTNNILRPGDVTDARYITGSIGLPKGGNICHGKILHIDSNSSELQNGSVNDMKLHVGDDIAMRIANAEDLVSLGHLAVKCQILELSYNGAKIKTPFGIIQSENLCDIVDSISNEIYLVILTKDECESANTASVKHTISSLVSLVKSNLTTFSDIAGILFAAYNRDDYRRLQRLLKSSNSRELVHSEIVDASDVEQWINRISNSNNDMRFYALSRAEERYCDILRNDNHEERASNVKLDEKRCEMVTLPVILSEGNIRDFIFLSRDISDAERWSDYKQKIVTVSADGIKIICKIISDQYTNNHARINITIEHNGELDSVMEHDIMGIFNLHKEISAIAGDIFFQKK